ncbi:MAG: hypothetical protein M1836_002654 [Candelina mexicana]|nr:MAG: hypothetical protein M1836_002654 [Candelina mexicana]
MSGQLLRQFAFPSHGQISLVLANIIKVKAKDHVVHRLVDAIPAEVKEDVAKRTEAAWNMPDMVPEAMKARAAKLMITSLDHESQQDPKTHSSLLFVDEENREFGKMHIASNPAEQEPAQDQCPVVFGAMTFGNSPHQSRITSLDTAGEVLDIFQSHGHNEIDTSRIYGIGTSEEYLGKLRWQDRGLVMDTKLYPTKNFIEDGLSLSPEHLREI